METEDAPFRFFLDNRKYTRQMKSTKGFNVFTAQGAHLHETSVTSEIH